MERIPDMATQRTTIEIQADIPPRAQQDLARTLTELGYEVRPGSASGPDSMPDKGTLWLRVHGPLEPEAAAILMRAASDWIRRRPAPKGRFRRRGARPITVTIFGQNGEQVASSVVERMSA
jgi:hypothetical protein